MKYLFRAQFNDGTGLTQSPDDTNPNGEGSSFSYLLEQEKLHGGVKEFFLEGEQSASVNLIDGTFTINGVSFGAHDQDLEPKDLRLIYFREVKQRIHGAEIASSEISRFFIGWQYTEDGKNHQQTIFLT